MKICIGKAGSAKLTGSLTNGHWHKNGLLKISQANLSFKKVLLLISILLGLNKLSVAQIASTNSVKLTNVADKSQATQGQTITHTLVLTNTGTTTVSGILVRDSISTGLRYLPNTASTPPGTTFTVGTPVSIWSVPSLSAGQRLSLTYQAVADSSGVLYSIATMPGDTAASCTSIPVRVCEGDTYLFQLSGPAGRSSYRWFKDGTEITDQTTRVLNVTAPGSYSLAIDGTSGKCPDLSLCPFIIEKYALPAFQVSALSASCSGSATQADGKIKLTGFNAGDTYQYAEGTDFNPSASLSGTPSAIPGDGLIASNLPNPTANKAYTIRVYNASGCYVEKTVILLPAACCSLAATATPGACDVGTNTFSTTVSVTLVNPTAGILTITDGPLSQTVAITGSATLSAVFTTIPSDGSPHTVTASLAGCSTVSATYTAPASCSVAPAQPTLAVSITPGACAPTTNQYALSGTISLSAAVASVLTLSDGPNSTTLAITAGQTTASFTLDGFSSDASSHTLIVSGAGYTTVSSTYTAPASCSVVPAQPTLAVGVTPGACVPATNLYTLSGTISLSAAIASVLTLTDGPNSTTLAITAGQTTASFTLEGLLSDAASHKLTLSGAGYTQITAIYTAPASCSVAPAVPGLTLSVTDPGICNPASNLYTSTGVIALTNAPAGLAIITDGTITASISISAGATSIPYSLTGLLSGSGVHTVTVSFVSQTASTTYIAPESCLVITPAPPILVLNQVVDKSKARLGELVSYTIVLTNTGASSATATTVQLPKAAGLTYVANSATPPAGTVFSPGLLSNNWTVSSIGAGQSLSLTFQARADSSGVFQNKAIIPGDTAIACTSVPAQVCIGESYAFRISAAPGHSQYKWFRTFQGVTTELTSFTTNVLDITQPGEYKLTVDGQVGNCPNFSCCPFIVEEDSLPSFQAKALPVSCVGGTAQANGQLVIQGFKPTHTYQYSPGATFDPVASLSEVARVIPTDGIITNTLTNPTAAQSYTVRVYNESGCYQDVTVLLAPTTCICPIMSCVPFVINQTKRVKRIGDSR